MELNYSNEAHKLIRSRIYHDLLKRCPLLDDHKNSLIKDRKFSEAQVEHFLYKSSPERNLMLQICRELYGIHGDVLLSVPGFYHSNEGEICFVDTPGMLIPQRSRDGHIWALQRRNEEGVEPRYVFISSRFYDEQVKVQPLPHWSHGQLKAVNKLWITEGALKADRVAAYFRERSLAVPGVMYWKRIVLELVPLEVEEIIVAFDQDMKSNENVARPVIYLFRQLVQKGYRVKLAIWQNVKGVDDAINSGDEIFYLDEKDAKNLFEKLSIKLQLGAIDWEATEEGVGTVSQAFTELRELPDPRIEVCPLSIDMIPEAFHGFCRDYISRMQVPLEFFAGPMIVFLSSLIGRKIRIKPFQYDNWTVVVNLWGATVAPPGALKTPSLNAVKLPFNKLEEDFEKEYCESKLRAQGEISVLNIQKKSLEDKLTKGYKSKKGLNRQEEESLKQDLDLLNQQIEEATPKAKRYLVNDITTEKLQMILVDNGNGVQLLRDELIGFCRDLEKPGREGSRPFYLEAWSGDSSFKVDRVGRGTLYIPALCISIFGSIQPDVLEAYLKENLSNGAGKDGLLQRFQVLFWPELSKDWELIDREPDSKAIEEYENLVMKIANYSPEKEYETIHFSEEAQAFFNEFLTTLELRLRSGEIASSDFQAHLAKYRSLLPSLALIFHVVNEFQSKEKIENYRIDLKTLKTACEWVKCLESHAEKLYFKAENEGILRAHLVTEKIFSGDIKTGTTVREIERKQWSKLTKREDIDTALEYLCHHGWVAIDEIQNPNGGRSKKIIKINPKVFDDFLN